MPLETANHIAELNASNPNGAQDFISEGDNQIRMIKKVLTSDLGRIAAPVSANHVDLSSTAYLSASGTANALIATPSPAWTGYAAGAGLWVKVAQANTGPVSINVSGLGAKSVKRPDGADLQSGDISAGAIVGLRYDGTQFQLASGTAILTPQRADARYLQLGGMKTYSRMVTLLGGSAGEWLKIARIQHTNPISEAESAQFSGFAFVQSDFGATGYSQSLFHFAFGSRGGFLRPVCTQMGDNYGGNRFAIYKESDGWHYLYLYRSRFSNGVSIQFQNLGCVEIFSVTNPVGTLVWDSSTGDGQSMRNGKNIVWDDRTAKLEDTKPLTLSSGVGNTTGTSYEAPGYYKDRAGEAALVGVMSIGSIPNSSVIATLPAGYRPRAILLFHASSTAIGYQYQVEVNPDGRIRAWKTAGGADLNGTLSLYPIRFRVYQ